MGTKPVWPSWNYPLLPEDFWTAVIFSSVFSCVVMGFLYTHNIDSYLGSFLVQLWIQCSTVLGVHLNIKEEESLASLGNVGRRGLKRGDVECTR